MPGGRSAAGRQSTGVIAPPIIAVLVVSAALAVVPASVWRAVTVHSAALEVSGLAIMIASTAFALWARVTLGTMWSLAPLVKDGHQLRTDGPYGITRHPIYTGLLGMFLGTILVIGLGRSLVVLPAGVVVLAIKARMEEALMLESFPRAYPPYRLRVPQLVPGLRASRRHHGARG